MKYNKRRSRGGYKHGAKYYNNHCATVLEPLIAMLVDAGLTWMKVSSMHTTFYPSTSLDMCCVFASTCYAMSMNREQSRHSRVIGFARAYISAGDVCYKLFAV